MPPKSARAVARARPVGKIGLGMEDVIFPNLGITSVGDKC